MNSVISNDLSLKYLKIFLFCKIYFREKKNNFAYFPVFTGLIGFKQTTNKQTPKTNKTQTSQKSQKIYKQLD